MKKQPKEEMRGESLLLKSSVLTGLVFIALIIMCNGGVIKTISFWFLLAPVYFFFITFLYSVLMDQEKFIKSTTFFSIYPILILVKLVCTASLIIMYTELAAQPSYTFWVLMVALYFIYSTLIAISMYKVR
tara:strand:- start:182 stop:574 length:393 start_codon:yes stop_codon:yes gene_type:complete